MGCDQSTEVITPCLEIAVLVKAGAGWGQQDVAGILLLSKNDCCIDGLCQVAAAIDITRIARGLDHPVQLRCPVTKQHDPAGLLGQLFEPA